MVYYIIMTIGLINRSNKKHLKNLSVITGVYSESHTFNPPKTAF